MGERLLCSVEDEGNAHVFSVSVDGDQKPEKIVTEPCWIGAWDWAGGTFADVGQHAHRVPRARGQGAGGIGDRFRSLD